MKRKKRKKDKRQPSDFGRRKAKESEKKKEKEGTIGRRNRFLCRKINVINLTHVLGESDTLSINLDVFHPNSRLVHSIRRFNGCF